MPAKNMRNRRRQAIGTPCPLCGSVMTDTGKRLATIDHIVPRAMGGPVAQWNHRIICGNCNLRRGVSLDGLISGLAMSVWSGRQRTEIVRYQEPNTRLLQTVDIRQKRSWCALLWDVLHEQPWTLATGDWTP